MIKYSGSSHYGENSHKTGELLSGHIFILYAQEDREKALEIKAQLNKAGYATWIDVDDMLPGSNASEAYVSAISEAALALVCVSAAFSTLGGGHQKLLKILEERQAQTPPSDIFMIPVFLEDCKVPYALDSLQPVKFYENGMGLLLRTLDNFISGSRSLGLPSETPKTEYKSNEAFRVSKSARRPGKGRRRRVGQSFKTNGIGDLRALRYTWTKRLSLFKRDSVSENIADKVTWLHLSDFHFRKDKHHANWQQMVVLDSLMRDVIRKLPEEGLVPNMVMISGDIAQAGTEAEYTNAKKFFDDLAKELDHRPEKQWFIVPGNHDVDRDAIKPYQKFMRDSLNTENAEELLGDETSIGQFAERQQGFFDFTGKMLGPARTWRKERPWEAAIYHHSAGKVGVLCLNTAFASQDNNDHGKLWLGEYQVREALREAREKGAELIIAMMHHPMDDLHDKKKSKGILESRSGCHFLLRGHLHDTELDLRINPSSGSMELAAGACWQDAKHPHAVMVVQLDLSKRKVHIHVWSYTDARDGFWARNNHLYQGMDNGHWEMPMPDSWTFGDILAMTDSPTVAIPAPLIPAAYESYLERKCGKLESLVVETLPVLMNTREVYVSLQTDWMPSDSTRVWGRIPEEKARRPLAELLDFKEISHFLISGDAGSGKSTFMRFTALSLLGEKKTVLPVLLSLRSLGKWLEDKDGESSALFWNWAGCSLQDYGLPETILRQQGGKGRILWLLDGLDEIFDPQRLAIAAAVLGNWSLEVEGDRVLITTRPHAIQQSGVLASLPMEVVRILDMNDDDQKSFLDRWFHAVYGSGDKVRIDKLKGKLWAGLIKQTHLDPLRRIPLLLGIIAIIYHEGKYLPERRNDLYQRTVDRLLQVRFSGADKSGDRASKMERALSYLARTMIERELAGGIGQHELIAILAEIAENKQTREELSRTARELGSHSGLLRLEGNPPSYSFLHLGFQKYLAALSFCEVEEPLQELKPFLDKEEWKEVVLLVAGSLCSRIRWLGRNFIMDLSETGRQEKKCRYISMAVQAAVEADSHILGDGDKQTLKKIAVNFLKQRELKSDLIDRLELGLSLGKLGDPRMGLAKSNHWIQFEGGKFNMGLADPGPEFPPEVRSWSAPVHSVFLNPFFMSTFQVTVGDFANFSRDGGYQNKAFWTPEGWDWIERQDDLRPLFKEPEMMVSNQPICGVCWHEAMAWCRWLTELWRLNPPKWLQWKSFTVRLPTEAEWEYAARGPLGFPYPWGFPKPDKDRCHYDNEKFRKPAAVGSFPAGNTHLGLADMAGNVWEWCLDSWNPEAYKARKGLTMNPKVGGNTDAYAARGGAFDDRIGSMTSGFRGWFPVENRARHLGFRACIVLKE